MRSRGSAVGTVRGRNPVSHSRTRVECTGSVGLQRPCNPAHHMPKEQGVLIECVSKTAITNAWKTRTNLPCLVKVSKARVETTAGGSIVVDACAVLLIPSYIQVNCLRLMG